MTPGRQTARAPELDAAPPPLDIQRLVGLWALNECGLGGVIHALRLPFTGILVGGTAVMILTLLAEAGQRKPAVILRALPVVLAIKFLVSPHTPLPAYAAVTYQALLAAALFAWIPRFSLAALLLGFLSLLLGGLQKLITMTLVFGFDLWRALDVLAQSVLGRWNLTLPRASLWFWGVLTFYYGVGGLLVGWAAARLPAQVAAFRALPPAPASANNRPAAPAGPAPPPANPRRRRRAWRALVWCLALALTLLGAWTLGGPNATLRVLVRTLLILSGWFLILAPLLRWRLARLQRRTGAHANGPAAQVLANLPALRAAAAAAWREARTRPVWRRWPYFIARLAAPRK